MEIVHLIEQKGMKFENCLEKTLSRRNKLLENISTIFERLNNHELVEKIFIEKYLKNTPEEEMKKSYPEYDEIVKLIDSLLIDFYK